MSKRAETNEPAGTGGEMSDDERRRTKNRTRQALYREKNKDRLQEKGRQRYQKYKREHSDKLREKQRRYREKNKEKRSLFYYANREVFREKARSTKYGISLNDLAKLSALQDHRCAICRTPIVFALLHVDHCHATKFVRGLLCRKCNIGIGYFMNCPKLLGRAIAYLKKPPGSVLSSNGDRSRACAENA